MMNAPALRLTARQLEVADRMSRRGATRRSVAYELGISEQTVRNHLSACYRAFDVDTLAQLIRLLADHLPA